MGPDRLATVGCLVCSPQSQSPRFTPSRASANASEPDSISRRCGQEEVVPRARNVALIRRPGASVPKSAPEPSEPAFTTRGRDECAETRAGRVKRRDSAPSASPGCATAPASRRSARTTGRSSEWSTSPSASHTRPVVSGSGHRGSAVSVRGEVSRAAVLQPRSHAALLVRLSVINAGLRRKIRRLPNGSELAYA